MTRRRIHRALAALLVIGLLIASSARADQMPPGMALLDVEMDGIAQNRIVTTIGQGDELAILRSDAGDLHLDTSAAQSIPYGDQDYVRLHDLPDIDASIDESRQVLVLHTHPTAFTGTTVEVQPRRPTRLSPSENATFVNYDLLAEGDSGTRARTLGGTVETGESGSFGLVDNTMTVAASGHALMRLDTSYTYNLPDSMQDFTVGDAISRAGSGGNPIRFAGIQFGRDFALQPGFVAFPTPRLEGQAALPSTVQVYVNNALRYQSDVPPGPFSIDKFPTVSGNGDTTLVVRDPLGRETVTQGSFYSTPGLLSEGLWDYSYAAGLERQDYGIESFDYRTPFASTLTRYGITSGLTGEVEMDGSGPRQVISTDVSFLLPGIGQATTGTSVSHGITGADGTLAYAGITRTGAMLSFSADIRHAFGGFTQFGDSTITNRGLSQFDTSVGLSLGKAGNFTIGYTGLQRPHEMPQDVATFAYGVQVTDLAYVALSVSSVAGSMRSTDTSLTFTMPLGGSRIASTSVEDRAGQMTTSASYAESPDNQRGFGGAATLGAGRFAQDDARLTWDGEEGSALAEVSHTAAGTGARIGGSGGFAVVDGDLYASRKLDDSFALVSVPDHPDVRVYRDNIEVARTDDSGQALVTGLLPYEANRLRLDIEDIPIGSALSGDTLEVTPGYRGAVAAAFDVKSSTARILILRQPDGTTVPAGAAVSGDGLEEQAFVGFDGLAFLIGDSVKEITASWAGHACRAALPVAAHDATPTAPVEITCQPSEVL